MSTEPYVPTPEAVVHPQTTLEPVPLAVGAVLSRSWQVMRDNLGIVVAAVAIQLVVQVGFSTVNAALRFAQQAAAEQELGLIALTFGGMGAFMQIAGGVLGLWLGLGAIRIFVNLACGRPANLWMLFGEGDKLLSAIVVGLVVGIGTMLGLTLLVVPGIIVGLALMFANYVLVDQEESIGGALSGSWRLAWPHLWFLFGFGLLLAVAVVFGGTLTLGLGFVFAAIFVPVLQAVVYQSLRHLELARSGGA